MGTLKRALDLTAAGLGLVICSPLLLAVATAIRLDGPGPVLFRQVRVGRGGAEFRILKFRTMRPDNAGAQVTSANDARITRVGAWLRRTKLDELPQLFNVLRGEMSLVGPRPEVPTYVAAWPPAARELILSVRPGITDPASVEFRHEQEELAAAVDPDDHYRRVILPRKVELYVEYVRTQSLMRDLKVLLSTIAAIVK